MKLIELLSPKLIFCNVDASSKKRVFNYIAEYINCEHSQLETHDIYSGLIQREKLGSTAIGRGIAIPHCRAQNCSEIVGVFLKLVTPIEFEAPDSTPVDLIFALVGPQESHQDHLEALSQLAELFGDKILPQKLRSCTAKKALYDTLFEYASMIVSTENPA